MRVSEWFAWFSAMLKSFSNHVLQHYFFLQSFAQCFAFQSVKRAFAGFFKM
jgi:hypothetical protein